jgi:hypothetical protein
LTFSVLRDKDCGGRPSAAGADNGTANGNEEDSMRFCRWNVRASAPGLALAVLLAAPASPGLAAETAAAKTSSCIACHTDVGKLTEEAKGIPVPAASALQAGKG